MGTKSSTTNTIIPVTFLHPRGGKEFSADIGPDTTGQKAIDGMIAAKFIEPPGLKEQYALQLTRTGESVPLGASLVASGAKANDTIGVVAMNSGAGR
jgi:hypothetical protein